MSGSKSVRPVRSILLFVVLLGTLACRRFCPECSRRKPLPTNPPLTPLPQAPMPQHNAHLYSDQDYSRGKRQWPNPFVVYTVREVAPLNVTNSGHIDQLLKDGKMYLSLNDAVAMALENNLDIGIQRYNLSIADTDILRTSSGAVALGVNAGLVQGTPGGTTGTTSAGGTGTSTTGSTGGGAGGTTIGVGGAGAGVGGIVASTTGRRPADRQLSIPCLPEPYRLSTPPRRSRTPSSPAHRRSTRTRPRPTSSTPRDFPPAP